jgi:hypothetical protein
MADDISASVITLHQPRPKKAKTGAERARAYRERKKVATVPEGPACDATPADRKAVEESTTRTGKEVETVSITPTTHTSTVTPIPHPTVTPFTMASAPAGRRARRVDGLARDLRLRQHGRHRLREHEHRGRHHGSRITGNAGRNKRASCAPRSSLHQAYDDEETIRNEARARFSARPIIRGRPASNIGGIGA